MSDTIHLACVTCRVELWVGQGGYSAPHKMRLYGTDEHREAFAAFYDAHPPRDGHDVRLVHLEGLDDLPMPDGEPWRDWTEFGEEPEQPDEPEPLVSPQPVIGPPHFPKAWAEMQIGTRFTVKDWPRPGINRFEVVNELPPLNSR